MKRLAYIELDTHAELVANGMALMHDNQAFEVDFYVSEKILKLINHKSERIIVADFSNIISKLSNQTYDLVIIGTAHRGFEVWEKIVAQFPTAIVVHNFNFTKTNAWTLFKSVFEKDYAYRIKLILKENLLKAPEIYQKAMFLLGIDEEICSEHQTRFFPLFFNEWQDANTDSIVRIVVPGMVSQAKRDYFSFFEKLKSFKNIGIHYEIVFLGKAEGEELQKLRILKTQLPNFIQIRFFEEKVPQKDFDAILRTADLLYCPIQPETRFFGVIERYGKTKVSGNVGDAIRFGKPAIFPKSYPSSYDFIIEEDKDLQFQISQLKHQRFDFSKFSKNNVQQTVEMVINGML